MAIHLLTARRLTRKVRAASVCFIPSRIALTARRRRCAWAEGSNFRASAFLIMPYDSITTHYLMHLSVTKGNRHAAIKYADESIQILRERDFTNNPLYESIERFMAQNKP